MKLVALTLCRNEGWCIAPCLRAALRWCDAVVVLDHASTDETPTVLDAMAAEYPGRIVRLHEPDSTWREMSHRQATLATARDIGATHLAIIDADEMLTENLVPRIRELISGLSPGEVLQLPWVTLWRSLGQYRSDPASVFSRSYKSVGFVDSPDCGWHAADGYDHHHTHPYGCNRFLKPVAWGDGGWLHYQHASWRRLVAKQTWYQMQELVRWGGVRANYRGTMDERGLQLAALPADWTPPELAQVNIDAVPWQEAEIDRMVSEHGDARFAEVVNG